jgi:pilus assembly protein CpaB
MNARGIILIVVALVLAGLAAFFARTWLSGTEQTVVEAAKGPNVLIAKRNLPIGKIIGDKDFSWLEWPSEAVHPGYITEGKLRENGKPIKMGDYFGHVVRDSMVTGEPITVAKLVKQGDRGFMAAILKPGMRAITIPVTRITGVGGFIFPGDRVDILLSRTATDDNGITRQVTETVFRNIRILGIDTRASDAKGQPPRIARTATIEVTPTLAEKVKVLQRLGGITLALRSIAREQDPVTGEMILEKNEEISEVKSLSWDAEVSSLVEPLEIGKQRMKVTVNRGTQRQVLEFKRDKK